MQNFFEQLSKKIGKVPGHLQFVGIQKQETTQMSMMTYAPESAVYLEDIDIAAARETLNSDQFAWINIDGLHDAEFIAAIGKRFQIEALILEDVVNTKHLPKFEEEEGCVFMILKMLYVDKEENKIEQEHLSLILQDKKVISFQEKKGDVFDTIRERILNGKGKVRNKGIDYLLFLLLDAVVDNYYLVLQYLEEQTESFETNLLKEDPTDLEDILQLKKQLIELRKTIYPLTEMLTKVIEVENELIGEDSLKYFRDVHDHIKHVTETFKDLREMTNGLIDLYMMNASNQMNHVMKTLTIVATVFIPLTFVAGIYGMNFDYMPELHWEYGYAFVWGIMFVAALGMYWFMKRKRWL